MAACLSCASVGQLGRPLDGDLSHDDTADRFDAEERSHNRQQYRSQEQLKTHADRLSQALPWFVDFRPQTKTKAAPALWILERRGLRDWGLCWDLQPRMTVARQP